MMGFKVFNLRSAFLLNWLPNALTEFWRFITSDKLIPISFPLEKKVNNKEIKLDIWIFNDYY